MTDEGRALHDNRRGPCYGATREERERRARLYALLDGISADIDLYAGAVWFGDHEVQCRERALLALGRLQMALGVK